ncbi:MAG: ribonuclease PH [Myxococcota bacterium]
MRSDGRRPDEMRPVRFEVDYTEQPLASVLCQVGRTWVLCTVCEEDGVPRFLQGRGRGWCTAEYSMLPGSTDTRGSREAARGKQSGRTQEIQRLIGRSLRAVLDFEALGERTLWIDCDVLQADGGTRCASITGASVALSIAAERLVARGELERNPVRDSVAAVSVGILGGELLLDLPYVEDSRAAVDMNVVATGAGQFVEVQGTGEDGTFSPDELAGLTKLALDGTRALGQLQAEAVAGAKR